MPTLYTVVKDDTLVKIAADHGFFSWRTIYFDASNAAFRARRPDPDKIFAGDQLFIPDKTPKAEERPTGEQHDFTTTTNAPLARFLLQVIDRHDRSRGIPGLRAFLQVPGPTIVQRTTDAVGSVELVEPDVTAGTVILQGLKDTSAEPSEPDIWYDIERSIPFPTSPDSDGKPVLNVDVIPDKRLATNRVAATAGVIRRRAWGARMPSKPYDKMPDDWDYSEVVIHHSGSKGRTDPKEIQNFQMDDGHFDDAAYEYMVHPDGRIFEGRYLTKEGAANAAVNRGKIGILVMGNFEPSLVFHTDTPTAAQVNSLIVLINALKTEFPDLLVLAGHRDLKETECPGEHLYTLLPMLRARLGMRPPP